MDTNYKDSANLTVWQHACMLLEPEVAFAIKPEKDLTDEDKRFLEDVINLESIKNFKSFQITSIGENENIKRDRILKYYGINLEKQMENDVLQVTTESFAFIS